MRETSIFKPDYARVIEDDDELLSLIADWESLKKAGRKDLAWKIRRGEASLEEVDIFLHPVGKYFTKLQRISRLKKVDEANVFDEVYVAACGRHETPPKIENWGAANFDVIWDD